MRRGASSGAARRGRCLKQDGPSPDCYTRARERDTQTTFTQYARNHKHTLPQSETRRTNPPKKFSLSPPRDTASFLSLSLSLSPRAGLAAATTTSGPPIPHRAQGEGCPRLGPEALAESCRARLQGDARKSTSSSHGRACIRRPLVAHRRRRWGRRRPHQPRQRHAARRAAPDARGLVVRARP